MLRRNAQELADEDETRAERKARLKAAEAAAASEAKKGKGGRKITARCWMAEEFPLSLQQLSPVLDVIGHANKHVARVRDSVFHRLPIAGTWLVNV